MVAESDSPSTESDEGRSSPNADEADRDRRLLLEEARTTTSHQLAQINKLDDEAVRTVRIAFVLSGLLVGGVKFFSLPGLGLPGILGTLSLIGSLITSLFVYGTSDLFVAPGLGNLSAEHGGESNARETYREVIERYERGLVYNRRVFQSNAIILGVSRLLLAGAIVIFTSALTVHLAIRPLAVSLPSELLSVVEIKV
jgi:hypothetical protein